MSDRAAALRARLVRNWNTAPLAREERAPLYESQGARLATGTAATQLGVSVDIVAPGKRGCPYHLHHAQEEVFLVLEGTGTWRVAGESLPVGPGDVLFAPAGRDFPHQLVNTGETPLKFLSISTRQKPEICEYPDSGKFLATTDGFDTIGRKAPLDYWDGEP